MKTFIAVSLALVSALLTPQSSLPEVTTPLQATQYAESAAADPVGPDAAAKRAAAMKFIENDHQTHVRLCSQLFQQMTANRSANAREITAQYLVSAAAFLYGHPEASSDSVSQNVAGLNAAAAVYESFLQSDPKTRSKFLDKIAGQQSAGTMKDFVSRTCK